AIVSVDSLSFGFIRQLVYSDRNKLHARHTGRIILLFDPSTKALIPIEASQEAQNVTASLAISPNADYIATIYVGKGENNGKRVYKAIVKRKQLTVAELREALGVRS